MRRTLFVSLLLAATSAFAQNGPVPLPRAVPPQEAILIQEKLFWSSYVAGDIRTLDTLLAPDFTNVEQEIERLPFGCRRNSCQAQLACARR